MKTKTLPTTNPENFNRAVEVLNRGGLVAFPTDTVYGLAAQVDNPAAIEKLYQAKQRSKEKAIPVLLGSPAELDQVAASVSPAARKLADAFWPGPLTLVIVGHPDLPDNLAPGPTLGVRIPDHPDALTLLGLTGPLAVTSANLSGGENASSAAEVAAQLSGRIDLILDGGITPGGQPSTVVDCTSETLKVLRAGPITEDAIQRELR
jgi:L-threonylcarbamoyladenylate synthase